MSRLAKDLWAWLKVCPIWAPRLVLWSALEPNAKVDSSQTISVHMCGPTVPIKTSFLGDAKPFPREN